MWWLLISFIFSTTAAVVVLGCGSSDKNVKKNRISEKSSSSKKSSSSRAKPLQNKSTKSVKNKKGSKRASDSSKSSKKSEKDKKKAEKSSRSSSSKKKTVPYANKTAKVTLSSESTSTSNETVAIPKIIKLHTSPTEMAFASTGGLQEFKLVNDSNQRVAFKVRSSDNQLYRVAPVYGVVEPHSFVTINVLRQNGATKVDKLVLMTTAVTNTPKQPKDIFIGLPLDSCQMTIVPLLVEAQ